MRQAETAFRMPKPGKALAGVMIAVLGLWVLFAAGLNWGGASPSVLKPFVGSADALRHGWLWVFLTAPLIHQPSEPMHVVTTLFGLYFLGPTLEDRWGTKKTLAFLFGSAAFAFALQAAVGAVVGPLAAPAWFGGLGMVEAVAVAWALQNRHATVRLFFVLPVSGTMLLVFIFGMSVLNVIAQRAPTEGLVTPFGGMLAGWLFSDGSPLRRTWLQLKLKRLQAETASLRASQAQEAQRRRAAGPPLRVIQGGADDKPPKDKRFLN